MILEGDFKFDFNIWKFNNLKCLFNEWHYRQSICCKTIDKISSEKKIQIFQTKIKLIDLDMRFLKDKQYFDNLTNTLTTQPLYNIQHE